MWQTASVLSYSPTIPATLQKEIPSIQTLLLYFEGKGRKPATLEAVMKGLKALAIRADLKRGTEAIPETVELRNKLIENTARLDNQMKKWAKATEENIDALRKIVGSSTEFQDWKAFTTEIEHLKESHIPKEVFDVQIKRIDEKIDNGLTNLNQRINDLKEIKFWSKRTILDISLAILATASTTIAALLASGIIHLWKFLDASLLKLQ